MFSPFTPDNILFAAKTITIATMGISTGAGLSYVAMIMPALRSVSPVMAATVWTHTAPAAKNIQIASILVSVLGGSFIYYKNKNRAYVYSAIIMACVLPYTAVNFLPINDALFKMAASGLDDGTIVTKMNQWYGRQFGRVFMNFAAFAISLYAGLGGDGKSV